MPATRQARRSLKDPDDQRTLVYLGIFSAREPVKLHRVCVGHGAESLGKSPKWQFEGTTRFLVPWLNVRKLSQEITQFGGRVMVSVTDTRGQAGRICEFLRKSEGTRSGMLSPGVDSRHQGTRVCRAGGL
jgi:hypothetical protein